MVSSSERRGSRHVSHSFVGHIARVVRRNVTPIPLRLTCCGWELTTTGSSDVSGEGVSRATVMRRSLVSIRRVASFCIASRTLGNSPASRVVKHRWLEDAVNPRSHGGPFSGLLRSLAVGVSCRSGEGRNKAEVVSSLILTKTCLSRLLRGWYGDASAGDDGCRCRRSRVGFGE